MAPLHERYLNSWKCVNQIYYDEVPAPNEQIFLTHTRGTTRHCTHSIDMYLKKRLALENPDHNTF